MTKKELITNAEGALKAGIKCMAKTTDYKEKEIWYSRLVGQNYICWTMEIFNDAKHDSWGKIINLAFEDATKKEE